MGPGVVFATMLSGSWFGGGHLDPSAGYSRLPPITFITLGYSRLTSCKQGAGAVMPCYMLTGLRLTLTDFRLVVLNGWMYVLREDPKERKEK